MAKIYFRRAGTGTAAYWSLYRVSDVEPEKRSALSVLLEEYQIMAGDIGVSDEERTKDLEFARREMREMGHTIHDDPIE